MPGLRLGTTAPTNLRLGPTQVQKVYIGTSLVWTASQDWIGSTATLSVNARSSTWGPALVPSGRTVHLDAAHEGSITYRANTDRVVLWDDLSGNGWWLKEPTPGTVQVPRRVIGYNGLPVLEFDGEEWMVHWVDTGTPADINLAQPITVHIVAAARPYAGHVTGLTGGSGSGAGGFQVTVQSNTSILFAAGNFINHAYNTDQHLITAIYNGASSVQRIDGVQVGTGNVGTGGVQRLQIGITHTMMNATICEMVFYNRVLTGPEITYNEDLLTKKWFKPPGVWTGSAATVNIAAAARTWSTGGTPAFRPDYIENCLGWWDASDASTFTYSSGVSVSQWRDKSAVAHHLGVAAPSVEPDRNGTMNGLATVAFDGTAWMYINGYTPPSQPYTLFMVASVAAGAGEYQGLTGGANLGPDIMVARRGSDQLLYVNAGIAHTSTLDTSPHVHGWVFDRERSRQRVDGLQIGTTNTGVGGFTQFRVGAGSFANFTLVGQIAEVCFYDRNLTSTEITEIEAYLLGKWFGPPVPQTWTGSAAALAIGATSGTWITPPPLFFDNFNRANGALGTNYVAPVGPSTPTVVMPVISGNVVVPSAEDANNAAMLSSGVYGDRQWSMIRAKLGVDYTEICAMTQMADTDDFFFGVWTTDGTHPSFPGFGTVDGPAFQIYRMVNGVSTVVLDDIAAPAPDGNFHRLKLVTDQRVFTLWFDGVRVLGPFDDSANTSVALTGRPGISMHRGAAGANPEIDEFSAGGFSAAIATPTLTTLTPNTASPDGGETITVTGTGLLADCTMVTLGGVDRAVTVTSATSGTFVTPVLSGAQTVTLTTPGGTSGSRTLTYNAPPPTVGNICEEEMGAPALHTSRTVNAPSDFTGAAGQGTFLWALAANTGGDPNITPPAGKGFATTGPVLHDTSLVGSNGIHIWSQGFWSSADVTADSTFTVTFASSYVSRAVAMTVNGTSGSGTTAQASIAGAGAMNLPSVTTTEANSLVLSMGLVDSGGTFTTPSGFTLATASPNLAYLYEWWAVQATAGATPTPSVTSTGTTVTIVTTTAFAPVSTVPTAPGAPTLNTATPGDTFVALAWTAGSNGGSVITSYVVEKSPNGTSSWTSAGTPTASPHTVTSLTNGTIQYFRVSAVNAIGTGAASNVLSATPGIPVAVFYTAFTAANGTALTSLSNAGTLGGSAFSNQSVSAGVAPPGSTIEVQSNKGAYRPPNVHLETPYLYTRTVPGNGTFYYNLTLTDVAAGGYIVMNYRQGTNDTTCEWWIHNTLFAVVGNVGSHGLTFVNGDVVHCLVHANGTAHSAYLWKNADPMPASPQVTGTGGTASPAAGAIQFQMKRGPTSQTTYLLDDLTVFADPAVRYPFPVAWTQDYNTMPLAVVPDWTVASGFRFGVFDFSGTKKCAVCHDGSYSYIDWHFSTSRYNTAFSGQGQRIKVVMEFENSSSFCLLILRASSDFSAWNGLNISGNGDYGGRNQFGGGTSGNITLPFNTPFEVELTVTAASVVSGSINGTAFGALGVAFDRTGLYPGMQIGSRAKVHKFLVENV